MACDVKCINAIQTLQYSSMVELTLGIFIAFSQLAILQH